MTLEEIAQLHPELAGAFASDAIVQVLYVRLADGQKLIFLGPPMDAGDVESVQEVTFGEHIHAALLQHVTEKHRKLATH